MLPARFSIIGFFALVGAASSDAIVIRHDRPDARYVELAKGFKAYGDVVEAGSTLIAPQWLLTAGHVAREISPYTSFATVNGREYRIDRVIMHPDYVKAGLRGPRDLALLHLTSAVKGVAPIALFRTKDEEGQEVTFFGRGKTGNGETGPTVQDDKMRGATNKLEKVDEESVYFEFDSPETATDLEGISGPGDSGGPALLKVNGKWAIAGISSSNGRTAKSKGVCTYHTVEKYARVSTAVEWIEATMRSMPESSVVWKFTSPWPSSRAGEVGAALLEAFNSGDPSVMEAFNQKYRDAQALGRGTPERRAKGYSDLFTKYGKMTAVECAQDPAGHLQVLLRGSKGEHYQLSLYFLDPASTRFDGYWIGVGKARR
jgi:hypothetical protein